MLGDVGQPELVTALGAEVPTHQVVVDRRTRLPIEAPLLGEHRPEALLRAQSPHPALAGCEPGIGQLVGDEAIPEGRVVGMDVHGRVDQVGVVPVPLADRVPTPLVERLGGKAQHPAGHRDGDPVSGKVEDQRVDHFGGSCLAK
jgi:hypothetical protein